MTVYTLTIDDIVCRFTLVFKFNGETAERRLDHYLIFLIKSYIMKIDLIDLIGLLAEFYNSYNLQDTDQVLSRIHESFIHL